MLYNLKQSDVKLVVTDATKVTKVISDSLDGPICDPTALANVESLKIHQRVGKPCETFV